MTKENFIEHIKAASGYEETEASVIAECVEGFRDLLTQNWSVIREIRERSDDKAIAITCGTDVNCSGPQPRIITKLGFSEKHKDERESFVENPNQLGFDSLKIGDVTITAGGAK